MLETLREIQRKTCKQYSTIYFPTSAFVQIGISETVRLGSLPVQGLRQPPEKEASGWYIWAGAFPGSDKAFQPLQLCHTGTWSPLALKFLGLPPGWRFLVTPDHEDAWYDESLWDPDPQH